MCPRLPELWAGFPEGPLPAVAAPSVTLLWNRRHPRGADTQLWPPRRAPGAVRTVPPSSALPPPRRPPPPLPLPLQPLCHTGMLPNSPGKAPLGAHLQPSLDNPTFFPFFTPQRVKIRNYLSVCKSRSLPTLFPSKPRALRAAPAVSAVWPRVAGGRSRGAAAYRAGRADRGLRGIARPRAPCPGTQGSCQRVWTCAGRGAVATGACGAPRVAESPASAV